MTIIMIRWWSLIMLVITLEWWAPDTQLMTVSLWSTSSSSSWPPAIILSKWPLLFYIIVYALVFKLSTSSSHSCNAMNFRWSLDFLYQWNIIQSLRPPSSTDSANSLTSSIQSHKESFSQYLATTGSAITAANLMVIRRPSLWYSWDWPTHSRHPDHDLFDKSEQ